MRLDPLGVDVHVARAVGGASARRGLFGILDRARQGVSAMNAERAAYRHGWFEWFGYWLHLDVAAFFNLERPAYWRGNARDLCLGQGIPFEQED